MFNYFIFLRKKKYTLSFNYTWNSTNLARKDIFKDLGIWFDTKLSFNKIKCVCVIILMTNQCKKKIVYIIY